MSATSAPAQLGRYRILQLLGRGGMAEVYLAAQQGAAGFAKPVALKLLTQTAPEQVRRLLREAHITVGLDHENLVQVLDLGEEEGRWFIAMEYVRGWTLAHVIAHASEQGERLPIAPMVHVVRAIASALEHAHTVLPGLMHRDVSPSNVLLSVDGRIKLSDFGVAAIRGDEETERLAGKPGYLPPEAFRRLGGSEPSPPPHSAKPSGAPPGAPPAQAWDVYALGVTLYEAIAARRAFPGGDWREVAAHVERGLTPVASVRPDCPAPLAAFVDRATHMDPAQRFPDARSFRDAIDLASPPSVDDKDVLRTLLASTYARRSFIGISGQLPSTGDAIVTVDIKPQTPVTRAPIRFGLPPSLGAGAARAAGERLGARLGDTLDRDVRTVVVASYRELVAWLAAGEIDFAWMPPVAFIDAAEQGARAVAVARRHGRTSYESAIFVRAESGYRALADLRGASVAWVDREAAAGYLYAVAELTRTVGSLAGFFKREHFLGSYQAVCEAVANGWAEAGAAYAVRDANGAVESAAWLELLGPRAAELRPIAFAGPIPGDNIAHRPGLDDQIVEEVAAALTSLASDPTGREVLLTVFNADGFVRVTDELYTEVRSTIRLAQRG